MGRLHGQRHSNTEGRQRNHRRCTYSDEHHLPEDRPDLEKLPGERRNQNPVKQTEIKLDVIFHLPLERAECQGARLDESRKYRARVINRVAGWGPIQQRNGYKRDRQYPRIATVQAATGWLGRATPPARRYWF